MFDIGWGELILIGIVALIAIGPKELPTVLRTLGRYMAKIKHMSAEFQSQFQEALREAEVADLKKHADDLTASVGEFGKIDPLADTTLKGASDFSASEPASGTPTNAVPEPLADGAAPIQSPSPIDGAVQDLPAKEDGSSLPPPKQVGGSS
jgi:sec-independent protein translocase protein TatB